MNTFSLALRNLLRNRRRSFTTLLAMVVGLVAILLFGGYSSSIKYGTQTGFVQYSGHLQIQRKGYFVDGGDNPTAYAIAGYQRLIDKIRQDPQLAPMLAVVTPTLQLGGIAGVFATGASRSVMATGLVAEDRNRMLEWNDYQLVSYAQPLPLAGAAPDAVVVGTGVARKLKLCSLLDEAGCAPGAVPVAAHAAALPSDIAALASLDQPAAQGASANRIEMLAATAHGAPNVASLDVIKANNMGIKALDDVYMAMHLAQAQRLVFGSEAPQVTAIIVQLKHTAQLEAARQRLAALLSSELRAQDLEVLDFGTLNPTYGQTNEFMDSMFGFIALLIGVIVLFTIGNTMSTAVVERTAEIGTLRAMGLRRSDIRKLFLCEAVVLGAAGAVAGVACALVVAQAINHSGWTWTPPGYSYAYLVQVLIGQNPRMLAGSVAGMLAVTLLSAWWPARRAARLAIVDALRHA
ncbi:FtsX-like permease family protein [Massilia solisilvae]|uniref:FtsX-like permease family protein n=1 Tax=Massilia solisilvae TaxID=1811225 RepID=A0ABT2BP86_9BURK|nr:FtsX-like permease family protein [Massilia solisilvae]MCS0610297.1 FtsX-like permease family protein [Massilia solisilvae]